MLRSKQLCSLFANANKFIFEKQGSNQNEIKN